MFSYLQAELGPLYWPLMVSALLACILICERFLILSFHCVGLPLQREGLPLLRQYQHEEKSVREEVLAIWLQRYERKLTSGLRILHLIAMVSPLVGLLGTVLGLIQVFETLGLQNGPVQPAMLAEGLGIAMKTTAAGLIIAIPSLLCAQGYRIWADKLIQLAEHRLNLQQLRCEGVSSEALA